MLSQTLSLMLLQAAAPAPDAPPGPQETVEVRSTRLQRDLAAVAGVSSLEAAEIASVAPQHPNQLFDRIPGAWISRGSGQESLTAVRSPVLSGPGACGAFMIIEDRVPIRPTGFCNVNELFEVNLLQAARIDVLRGPGTVIYGSNALHGVLDVSSADPDPEQPFRAAIEAGSDDYYRGRVEASTNALSLRANYVDSRSFRTEESYTQGQANLTWLANLGNADVRNSAAWADLDQQTAGFIYGENAYKDEDLRTGNENPEAFREADAWRVASQWQWAPTSGQQLEAIAYARHSDMLFLQHFLPGQPLEANDQDSAGLLLSWSPHSAWRAGMDLEWANGELVEYQEHPTQGSAFLVATRPQGFHYDYEVQQLMAAAWVQGQHDIDDIQYFTFGLRSEYLKYDYDNRMLDGNTRDDGTPCGFGGCLYTRPADRNDDFLNLAPELGYGRLLNDQLSLRLRAARGFRAPQTTELYRLQSGQTVADIDSEILDTLEIGLDGGNETLAWDLAAYVMHKKHFIFRDADGLNVSDGKTHHLGLEGSFHWAISAAWNLSGNLSWAQHEYAFDRLAGGGEVISDGNQVDTAPEWLGAVRLEWQPAQGWRGELEWVQTGAYYIDAANEHDYGGHGLLNLHAQLTPGRGRHLLGLRINNIFDTWYG
jgi:outer membrane receptor protein involved in Fe transport